MNRHFRLQVVIFLAMIWSASVVIGADNNEDNFRIVTTGEILKIDAKKKTFEFRIVLDSFPPGGRYGGPRGGGRGGRIGGRGRFPETVLYIPTMVVKVFISDRTSLRLANGSADFSLLKVGQRVSVTAV